MWCVAYVWLSRQYDSGAEQWYTDFDRPLSAGNASIVANLATGLTKEFPSYVLPLITHAEFLHNTLTHADIVCNAFACDAPAFHLRASCVWRCADNVKPPMLFDLS